MKINVDKKILVETLSSLERIIPHRSIASGSVEVELIDNLLVFNGASSEIDLSISVPILQNKIDFIEKKVIFSVQVSLFSKIVKSLNGENIELELLNEELILRCGGSEFKIQISHSDNFANIIFPENINYSVDSFELSKAFSCVRYASSSENFQPIFKGIKIEKREKGMRLIATDGYRVALYDFAFNGDLPEMIVPAKTADEIIKILKDSKDNFAKIGYTEGQLHIFTDRAKMNIRLMEGSFPDYEKVFPYEINLSVKLQSNVLKEAVNRVALLVDKNSNNRVEFLISEDKLKLSAESEYGNAQDTLSVKQDGKKPAINTAFNAKYVQDALGPIEGEVEISLLDSNTPALFKPTSNKNYMALLVALKF